MRVATSSSNHKIAASNGATLTSATVWSFFSFDNTGFGNGTSFGQGQPDHDAHQYATARLLARGETDLLFWITKRFLMPVVLIPVGFSFVAGTAVACRARSRAMRRSSCCCPERYCTGHSAPA